MRIGSLFSGIGGLEMGLEAAIPGAHTVWQVEQAEYPRRILAKHWPNAKRYEDVCMVHRSWDVPGRGATITQPLAPVDLICGGFPCQDISTAGKGAGLSGKRSGLWFEYLRIVRNLRPRWVVIENVGALRRRGLGAVLWGLAGLGYDAEWSVLSAADVGAPHLRKRLFIIAHLPHSIGSELRQQPGRKRGTSEAGGEGAPIARLDGAAEHVADRNSGRCEEQREPQLGWEQGSRGGIADGCGQLQHAPEHVANTDRHRGEQGGMSKAGRKTGPAAKGGDRIWKMADSCGLRWNSRRRIGERPGSEFESGARRNTVSGVGGVTHGLSPWTYRGTDPEAWEQRVARTVKARSVPDRGARLRALGNAVVPQCAYEVGRRVVELQAMTYTATTEPEARKRSGLHASTDRRSDAREY